MILNKDRMGVRVDMKCTNCQKVVQVDDKFCMHCGNNLELQKEGVSKDILDDEQCPKCKSIVGKNDKFCMNCGYNLSGLFAKNQDVKFANEKEERLVSQSVESIDLKNEAKNLFENTTKSIGKLAGSEEGLNLNLRDMFSEVFKPHTKDESDEIFIAGTSRTTPLLDDVSEEWGKPWVFSRVFLAFAITFAALWVLSSVFENTLAIPGLIFIGALTVPLTGLFFFFESNAFKNISLFEVLKMFFVGGVISLLSTMVLYNFISFSDEYYLFGSMTIIDAGLVGIVEETGKSIIIVYFINKYKTNKILNGLLIGGAIGAGFAMFESAGYILNYSEGLESTLISMVFIRAWTAIGSHLVWSAIIGAAIVIAKESKNFEFSNIKDKRFLFFFTASVVLHSLWDTSFSLFGSYMFKYVALIIIVWLLVFILMKAGLKQVNKLQIESKELKIKEN